MTDRPVTTRARGVCKYYNTSRGCFAGKNCKFLHGEGEKLTLYDQSKTCRYFAAGYCKRGSDCWFAHVAPTQPEVESSASTSASKEKATSDDEEHFCCICLEKPLTYGLLTGCSHIFCISCIRSWRDRTGKSVDMITTGVTKKCPLCRASSSFVTPSSHFYPQDHPGKEATIERYKESMSRVPCRYFQKSPPTKRFCPFGKDCFYQHLNDDGTPYVFSGGVDQYIRRLQRFERRNPVAFSYETDPWMQEFALTLDALRASIFDHGDPDDDHPDDDDDDDDDDEVWEEYSPMGEYLQQEAQLTELILSSPTIPHTTVAFEPHSPISISDDVDRDFMREADLAFLGELVQEMGLAAPATTPQEPPVPWPCLELLSLTHQTPSLSQPSNEVSDALAPVEAAVINPPPESSDFGWGDGANIPQPSDPPLLTDGRGRVVWSTAPASRRRRVASSSVPSAQHRKCQDPTGDIDVQGPVEPSRSPPITRSRSLPEPSIGADDGITADGSSQPMTPTAPHHVATSSYSLVHHDLLD